MIKRFILLLPTAIFPYSLVAVLISYILDIGDFERVINIIPAFFIISLICEIIFIVASISEKWDYKDLALYNMLVKIVQIPAYICTFAVGIACLSTLFTLGIAIVFFLFDCVTICLTGIVGVVAITRARAEGFVSKRFAILNGILQFVFCIDVISAAVLFLRIRAGNRA